MPAAGRIRDNTKLPLSLPRTTLIARVKMLFKKLRALWNVERADEAERHLLEREAMPPLQRNGNELCDTGASLAGTMEEDALLR